MIDGQEIKLSADADAGSFLTTYVQSLNLIFNTCEIIALLQLFENLFFIRTS